MTRWSTKDLTSMLLKNQKEVKGGPVGRGRISGNHGRWQTRCGPNTGIETRIRES